MKGCLGLLVLALITTAAGCGSDQRETAPVSGKVTLADKPVTEGQIMFWPDDGGPPATGNIGPDGGYSLRTYRDGDGAVPGSHKVTIKAVNIANPEAMPKSMTEELASEGHAIPRTEWLVPRHYSQRDMSGLTAEVNEGENTIDFDLEPR